MAHGDIYKMFEKLFPMYASNAVMFFPHERNSIRIRMAELDQEFIFTYYSNKEWRFETVNMTTRKGK